MAPCRSSVPYYPQPSRNVQYSEDRDYPPASHTPSSRSPLPAHRYNPTSDQPVIPPQNRIEPRVSSATPPHAALSAEQPSRSATAATSDHRPRPDSLIIGLFALRLAQRLIQSLDTYTSRAADITWLTCFLSAYSPHDALARITGARLDDYISTYPAIIRNFITQPKYPFVFTQMSPDRQITHRRLTDQEALEVVDFADAASEWGSTVRLPAAEGRRMEELAGRRRVAK